MLSSLRQEQDAYNASSLQRWSQLQKMARRTNKSALRTQRRALQTAKKLGRTRKKQIKAAGQQQLADVEQQATSRGLGNTTVRSSLRRGVQSDIQNQLSAVNESIAAQQAGLLSQRAGLQADLGRFSTDTFLSRSDQFPQVSNILQLLRRMG
jgi:hypothetical protein